MTAKVNLEAYGGVRFIDAAGEVGYFQAAFDQAARLALSPKASAAFIADLPTEWENRDE